MELKIKNAELRIMNYGRCRACGTTNKMLDASSLSLLCMTAMYCATEAKTNPIRHSV